MTRLATPADLRAAEHHLASTDPILAPWLERVGRCRIAPWEQDPFTVLARSIVGQQLSARAAGTIFGRVLTLLGGDLSPAPLLAASPEDLRECGLSGAKIRSLQGIAAAVQRGACDLPALRDVDDETALAALVALPGVGRWTGEMFLIFALGHADVLALGDAGLRRAASRLYGREALTDAEFTALAEPWRPWRSVASWYLWRSLEATGAGG